MGDARLKALVAEAIRNARENGAAIDEWTPEELADDLFDCDAEISDLTCGPDGFRPEARQEVIAIIEELRK